LTDSAENAATTRPRVANSPRDLTPRRYSDEEQVILEAVGHKYGVSPASILELIDLESTFHHMGRRRGLIPALREVVAAVAARQVPTQ
jgi:hypothetical protein